VGIYIGFDSPLNNKTTLVKFRINYGMD